MKPYTLVSPVNQKGSATFIVKVYRETKDFPNGGKLTQHLENKVNVGDEIMVSGPIGMYRYLGDGRIQFKDDILPQKRKLALLAAGTGVTPLYAMALASTLAKDNLEINFFFSNKEKTDIIMKEDLEKLAGANPNFKVDYTLTRQEKDWGEAANEHVGRINWEMLESAGFPKPADDIFYIACGTPDFNKSMAELLAKNGYEKGKHFM